MANEMTADQKEDYAKRFVLACREEASSVKQNRMTLNKDNYAMYQLEHDFSHKQPGQSREILSKTRNSVEQIKSFFQQALADLDDWYRIEARNPKEELIIKPEEMYKLMNYMLERGDYFSHVGFLVQAGLLGSLSIGKVTGEMVSKPKFTTRKEGRGKSYTKHVVAIDDKVWELRFDIVRQENYYPDPSGSKLYDIEESEVDLHKVKQLSAGDEAIYEKTEVDELQPWAGNNADEIQTERLAAETGQNTPMGGMRPKVKLTEFFGTIVDEDGDILFENVVMTLANNDQIIRPPTPNPLWHQKCPRISAALIEVANSVWGIALMDAGTKHNRSLTEIFNLMLDSAMKAIWGVNQIRVGDLEDPTQITNGIPWGTHLKVAATLPAGAKVMEQIITGAIQPDVMNMFNLLNQETLTSMMTNDLRMGAQSMRAVKATEVVAAENSITSVFQGMAKNFEGKMIQPELELACWTVCQNWDLIDKDVFKSLFGTERGEQLSQMEPQDVFVNTINGMKFKVFGISLMLRRQADFRKWTSLLQVVGGSSVLIEAFMAKYSFGKLLGEIMTALDVDKSKIGSDDPVAVPGAAPQEPPAPGPDMASQQPSAAGAPSADPFAAAFTGQQMNMPSSQALA